MTKELFKMRLLSLAALCGSVLALVSCANEDITQKDTNTDNGTKKNLTTFVTGEEPTSRTSMDYATGAFYWEAGDHIYVQDDSGTWKKSKNAPTGKTAYFKFLVPGKFENNTSYKVYYPGKNGSNNQVIIPAAQTQTAPNTTTHLGESGDCGTATANKVTGKNQFSFTIDHQAAILVFQPYTSNTILKDCYLTKVEVTADNDIASTYTLDPTSGELTGSGTGKQIVLTTQDPLSGSVNENGFPLNTTVASVATNGAYMVIKPGTHVLKVRYWIKDMVTNIEGTITKNLSSFTYAKNTYYDMTADLNVKNYDGDHYYMWDAKKQYWDGWEWTKNLPGGQPTINDSSPSPNFPQNNSDPRWYHEVSGAFQATESCVSLPNANELAWYAKEGDPRWDEDEVWTTMGHLYKGGMWFKKKSQISGFNANTAPDGTDFRISSPSEQWPASNTPPSAADAGNYFYLPALGFYRNGMLRFVGQIGSYWGSSATSWWWFYAYQLSIQKGSVEVGFGFRSDGYRVDGAFE